MAKGRFFCDELEKLSSEFNFKLQMTGPASMPYPWFEGDENLYQIQKFCKLASSMVFFSIHIITGLSAMLTTSNLLSNRLI